MSAAEFIFLALVSLGAIRLAGWMLRETPTHPTQPYHAPTLYRKELK
jgi:hypothetical protein